MKQPNIVSASAEVGGQTLTISTGELAKQAGGSVLVQLGETVVLGTATMNRPMSEDADWMPLLVDYEEKYYAAGKIKGSRFMKREGRPSDDAILNARLIDRSIRPLFHEDMINDTQIVLTILSFDGENSSDVPALIAACAAITISDIPWNGPLAGVRIGRVEDKFVINPTVEQRANSTLDLLVAGTDDSITMIESGGHEVVEDTMLDGLEEAQSALGQIIPLIDELQQKVGKEKQEPFLMKKPEAADIAKIKDAARDTLIKGLKEGQTKQAIGQAERDAYDQAVATLGEEEVANLGEKHIRAAIHDLHAEYFREQVLSNEWRADDRKLDEIRDLYVKVDLLPRTHGSGLFQRGDTQILTTLTLGGPSDVQIIDTMEVDMKKRYIHFYNFPAFSVGETKPNRGPGRREIGHGSLAERALLPVLPDKANWPYTMLLVSEVLESHGSSSMASACGSSLALMAAGVPIKKAVAGIAMGLVSDADENSKINNYKVLTDIAGIEDEKGDMDFKVAGTKDGITALQMDVKVKGLTRDILSAALEQAKQARLHILEAMNAVISEPRAELSPHAPRIETIQIDVEKIGDLIGPKGKFINEIIEKTGVEIDIADDGLVSITSNDADAMKEAKQWVNDMTKEVQPGDKFTGKVTRLMNFGAFVEIVPGQDGLVHISEFSDQRVDKIEDVAKVGDEIDVVVTEIDDMGRINLSHKAAVNPGSATPAKRPAPQNNNTSSFSGPSAPKF